MSVSVFCTGAPHISPLLGVFWCAETDVMWTKWTDKRRRERLEKWPHYREPTEMRWAPCALTQSSCPPGRTVTSRPIRSEQQGGACKVSRERAMGENVSITTWDAASQPDSWPASANSAVFDRHCDVCAAWRLHLSVAASVNLVDMWCEWIWWCARRIKRPSRAE